MCDGICSNCARPCSTIKALGAVADIIAVGLIVALILLVAR